jgi:hypothetical protein
MVSGGQSMQESPEASRCRSRPLRCGCPGLVCQQGGQFPPFLALGVQSPAQVVAFAFHLFEFAAQPLKLSL